MNETRKTPSHRSRGQALVEFALVLPLLLLIIFLIIEFARLFQAWLVIENVARSAARYAVTGNFDAAYCPVPGDKNSCSDDSLQNSARLDTVRDIAYSTAAGIQRDDRPPVVPRNVRSYYKVIVCGSRDLPDGDPDQTVWDDGSSTGQPPTCSPSEFPGDPGRRVLIYVEFDHPIITPLRAVIDWVPLIARREMIVENFRAVRIAGVPPSIAVPSPTPSDTPTPSNTATNTTTSTRTNTSTPSNTFTPSSTRTPTRTGSPTRTATDTATATATNTRRPTRTFTSTSTRTPTPCPVPACTPTPTNTRTPTFTPSNTATRTLTPSITPTPSRTNTRTNTFTPSNTRTRTNTPTITNTRTNTRTPTETPEPSDTPTPSRTNTRTPTVPSNTPTQTRTPSRTPTASPSPTICFDC